MGRALGSLGLVDHLSSGGLPGWALGEVHGVLLRWLVCPGVQSLSQGGVSARLVRTVVFLACSARSRTSAARVGVGGVRKPQSLSHSCREYSVAASELEETGNAGASPSGREAVSFDWRLSSNRSCLVCPAPGMVPRRAELGDAKTGGVLLRNNQLSLF